MSRRTLRAWLGLWTVVMVYAVFAAGWVGYATLRQSTVVKQLAPGESLTTSEGSTFRVVSMMQTTTIPGGYDGAFTAAPGATWIIVTYEVTRSSTKEICPLELVGRDGRTWDYSTDVYGRPLDFTCLDLEVGKPGLVEMIFQIPLAEADHLIGLHHQYEMDWRLRTYALRPPPA